jgi:hypothetical protein
MKVTHFHTRPSAMTKFLVLDPLVIREQLVGKNGAFVPFRGGRLPQATNER